MKKSIFRKILNEEYIEVNKSVSKTIECLCEQSGMTQECEGVRMYFQCTNKGKIVVSYRSGYGRRHILEHNLYYVYGEVISKDDKTYVNFTSVYDKTDWLVIILLLPFVIALLPIYFLLRTNISSDNIAPVIVACALTLAVPVASIVGLFRQKNNGDRFVKLMEDELKRRVHNISRWDD